MLSLIILISNTRVSCVSPDAAHRPGDPRYQDGEVGGHLHVVRESIMEHASGEVE